MASGNCILLSCSENCQKDKQKQIRAFIDVVNKITKTKDVSTNRKSETSPFTTFMGEK